MLTSMFRASIISRSISRRWQSSTTARCVAAVTISNNNPRYFSQKMSTTPSALKDDNNNVVSNASSVVSSPFDTKSNNITSPVKRRGKKRSFVPRIAAVRLTDNARTFFQRLLRNPPRPEIVGVMLNYDQSKTGEPRMVYSFSFVTQNDIDWEYDEGVSLEVVEETDTDGNTVIVPKPPSASRDDGLPKLFVHHNAFLKVLGATVDVDTRTVTPILYDRENNRMDPNA